MRILCFALLTFFSLSATAQGVITKRPDVGINSNCNGYLEYLPEGYATNTSQHYPLMVFFMGINSTGPGTDASLQNLFGSGYMQDMMLNGTFPSSFTVNGQTHRFIVIIPQLITDYNTRPPTPEEVNDILDYTIQHYRVDTTRIYLTGNSSGGGPVLDYPAASSAYADRIAAVVPFGSVFHPSQEKADIIKYGHVAVWAFHNEFDPGVPVDFTKDIIKLINMPPPPDRQAKATIFQNTGHDCWTQAYTMQYEEDNLNIYEWMLQFSRTVTTANAGLDQNISLPANSVQLSGSGTGPNGTASTYNWVKLSGPSQGGLNNAAITNPVAANLVEGTYIFRLTITDNNGGSSFDDVAITVYPPRIEAESYANMSGVSIIPTTDESGSAVGSINTGDWMDYTVNVPVAGSYRIRFRVTGWWSFSRFQVKDAGGNVLTSAEIYWTGDWEHYITMERVITLPAGIQTLRIEGINAADNNLANEWHLNWLQLILQASNAPLPVSFDLLNARCADGMVNISWKTSREMNTNNYLVEKSSDGRTWTSIATIRAAGQSTTQQSYTYTDAAGGTNNLYRIVEVEKDGRKTISSIVRSNCGGRQSVNLYPNPVVDRAMVDISLEHKTKLKLSLIDSKGATVQVKEIELAAGTSQFPINMAGYARGNYTLQLQWDHEHKTIQLVRK